MKRKTLILVTFILLIGTTFAWSQATGLTSLSSDFSYGVFPSELDSAANVGLIGLSTPFEALPFSYVFAGVGNPNKINTTGALTATITSPLWAGFYRAGNRPWSVFAGFGKTDAGYYDSVTATVVDEPTTTTSTTYGATVPVTVGTTTTNYEVMTQQTETTYKTRAFRQISDGAQVILGFPVFNVGAYFWMNLDNWTPGPVLNNSYGDGNNTQTVTNYYNAAGAGAEPNIETDYTSTTVSSTNNSTSSYTITVPFFLPTSGPDHFAQLSATLSSTDQSATQTVTNTAPMDTGTWGTAQTTLGATVGTDSNMSITSKTSSQNIYGQYRISRNGFLGNHPADQFYLGLGIGTVTNAAEYQTSTRTDDYTIVPGVSTKTQETASESTASVVYKGSTGLNAGLGVGHSLYWDFGPASFGLMPQINAAYSQSQTNPNSVTSWTGVTRTDGDADGAFTTAADTIVTTTNTYTNTVSINTATGALGANPNLTSTSSIMAQVSVPIALQVRPEGWPFGFIIGAQPQASMTYTSTTTNTAVFSQSAVTTDGTGAVTATNDTTAQSSAQSVSDGIDWNLSIAHNAGVEVMFAENIKVLVNIAAAVAGGVWDFRNLVVQGFIGIP